MIEFGKFRKMMPAMKNYVLGEQIRQITLYKAHKATFFCFAFLFTVRHHTWFFFIIGMKKCLFLCCKSY